MTAVALMDSLSTAQRTVSQHLPDAEGRTLGDPVARAGELARLLHECRAADAAHDHRVAMNRVKHRMAQAAFLLVVLITLAALAIVVVTVIRADYRVAAIAGAVGLSHVLALYVWTWRFVLSSSVG